MCYQKPDISLATNSSRLIRRCLRLADLLSSCLEVNLRQAHNLSQGCWPFRNNKSRRDQAEFDEPTLRGLRSNYRLFVSYHLCITLNASGAGAVVGAGTETVGAIDPARWHS